MRGRSSRSLPTVTLGLLVGLVTGIAEAAAQIPVTVAWDAVPDGVTVGFEVQVGVAPGAPLVTIDVGTNTRTTLPLPAAGVYYVSVRGYSAERNVGPSTPELVVDLVTAPGPPSTVRAQVQGTLASLSWQPPQVGGVPSRYLVSVGTARGASNVLNESPVGNVLGVSGVVPPGTYFARVQAGNMVGVGPPSADVVIQVNAGVPPSPPRSLGASWVGRRLTLTWLPPADGSATSFILEAGSVAGAADIGALNLRRETSFVVDVPPGIYYVRVRSVNAEGVSAPSNEIVLR